MFKTFRRTVASLLSIATLVAVPVVAPVAVYAATNGDIQNCLAQGTNLDATGNGSSCANTDTSSANTNINNIIKTIVNIFSLIVGIIAVIMIIVGGFKYITSGGESNNISSAKSTIIYAIIGLVVVALAQFIVQFVLNKVTNSGS